NSSNARLASTFAAIPTPPPHPRGIVREVRASATGNSQHALNLSRPPDRRRPAHGPVVSPPLMIAASWSRPISSAADIHLSVVIPAFNEALRLPRTLGEVLGYLARQPYRAEVVVVDDGSTDDTARLVREWPPAASALRLIAHPDGHNHGKGATVRRGMAAAEGRYRLFMDADNSTPPDHLQAFWPWGEKGYDVVIGSRRIDGAHLVIP